MKNIEWALLIYLNKCVQETGCNIYTVYIYLCYVKLYFSYAKINLLHSSIGVKLTLWSLDGITRRWIPVRQMVQSIQTVEQTEILHPFVPGIDGWHVV